MLCFKQTRSSEGWPQPFSASAPLTGTEANIDWYFATSSNTVGYPFYIYVGLLQ